MEFEMSFGEHWAPEYSLLRTGVAEQQERHSTAGMLGEVERVSGSANVGMGFSSEGRAGERAAPAEAGTGDDGCGGGDGDGGGGEGDVGPLESLAEKDAAACCLRGRVLISG